MPRDNAAQMDAMLKKLMVAAPRCPLTIPGDFPCIHRGEIVKAGAFRDEDGATVGRPRAW